MKLRQEGTAWPHHMEIWRNVGMRQDSGDQKPDTMQSHIRLWHMSHCGHNQQDIDSCWVGMACSKLVDYR